MDRTSKIILALIAAGLWANVAAPLILPAKAQDSSYELRSIKNDVSAIATGVCVNGKIC